MTDNDPIQQITEILQRGAHAFMRGVRENLEQSMQRDDVATDAAAEPAEQTVASGTGATFEAAADNLIADIRADRAVGREVPVHLSFTARPGRYDGVLSATHDGGYEVLMTDPDAGRAGPIERDDEGSVAAGPELRDRMPGTWAWRTGQPHVNGENGSLLFEQTDLGERFIGEMINPEFALWVACARDEIQIHDPRGGYLVASQAADELRAGMMVALGLDERPGDLELIAHVQGEIARLRAALADATGPAARPSTTRPDPSTWEWPPRTSPRLPRSTPSHHASGTRYEAQDGTNYHATNGDD